METIITKSYRGVDQPDLVEQHYDTQIEEDIEFNKWKELQEKKARNKRIYQRMVFYLIMILLAAMVIFLEMHWLAKVFFEIGIATVTLGVYALDTATEVDQEIPMSPDEKILQDELERGER